MIQRVRRPQYRSAGYLDVGARAGHTTSLVELAGLSNSTRHLDRFIFLDLILEYF